MPCKGGCRGCGGPWGRPGPRRPGCWSRRWGCGLVRPAAAVGLGAEAAKRSGHGNDEAWLRRVEADYDNLRAAMDRAVAASDPETALRLAGALGWYWAADHHDEGRRRLQAALALAPEESPHTLPGQGPAGAGPGRRPAGAGPATLDAARRSLELFERLGDRHAAAMSKLVLGQSSARRSAAATRPGCSRRPRRPSRSWATAGARRTRSRPSSRPRPTSASRPGRSPWPSRPWRGTGRGDPELAARAERHEADLAAQAAAAALAPEAFRAATAAGRALAPDQALRVALG
jgi:hypothetical protein